MPAETVPVIKTDRQPETNLDLWKYFTDDASKIKDRMWTIASWLFTLQSAVLAFIGNQFTKDKMEDFYFDNRKLVILLCVIGVVLSLYTLFMIQQYGRHIRSMWNRADLVRRQIPGLTEIWFVKNDKEIEKDKTNQVKSQEEKSLPPVCWRLIYLCIGFMIVFVALFLISIFYTL